MIAEGTGRTLRQQIIDLLQDCEMNVAMIAKKIGSSEKAVEGHLPHVAKSMGRDFVMIPSECHDCGFVFAKRERFERPTKCPHCRSEHISEPLFVIRKD